jgi:hypothetical protein
MPDELTEAATLKAQAQGLLRAAHGLLAEKALPEDVKTAIQTLRTALRKTWADLEGEIAPAEEAAAELESDCVPLVESLAFKPDGSVPIRIIAPGWGSTGYYGSDVLARDGPTAFPKGTKMFWNHITKAEEAQRPEGDLRNLAGELTTDARYDPAHAQGPGLYADAKVFTAFRPVVEELAPHIGVSIRAEGKTSLGEAEGRKGVMVSRIVAGKSIDYVTQAGAGGKVLEMFEAARANPAPSSTEAEMDQLKEKQFTDSIATLTADLATRTTDLAARTAENVTLVAENARIKEALLLHEARAVVTATLAPLTMPDVTRTRLAESLATRPVLKDGALDRDAYVAMIEGEAHAEMAYLATVGNAGKITGLGVTPPPGGAKTMREAFVGVYLRQGKTQAEAEQLAAIAAQGR